MFKVGDKVKDKDNSLHKAIVTGLTDNPKCPYIIKCSCGYEGKDALTDYVEEEMMGKFKVGDRVKVIKKSEVCYDARGDTRNCYCYVGRIGTVCEVSGKDEKVERVGVNNFTGTDSWCSAFTSDCLELAKEATMSKYQELKERIENLKNGWDKEANDILEEIYNATKSRESYRRWIMIDIANDGHILIRDYDSDNATLWDETFTGQCEKLKVFKQALLWLLDHSDIKKDEKEEEIKELEAQRDTLAAHIRSLNLKMEELRR